MSLCGDTVQVFNVSELCKLHLTLVEAKNLPAADSNGLSDPYVEVRAENGLIVKDGAIRTIIKSETLNPKWNQSFDLSWNQRFRKLVLRVYDHDKWSKDDYLGKASIYYHELCDQAEHDIWLPLYKSKKGNERVGEIHVKYKAAAKFPLVIPPNALHLELSRKEQDVMVGFGWDLRLPSTLDTTSAKASFLGLDYRYGRVDRFSAEHNGGFGGCVRYIADNLSEDVDIEDNENYSIQLHKLSLDVKYLIACIHIGNGINSFSCVKGAFVRVTKEIKKNTNKTLAFHRLTESFSQRGCIIGVIKRSYNNQWVFTAAAHPITGANVDESAEQVMAWAKDNITP